MREEKGRKREREIKTPYFSNFIKNHIFYIFSQKFHIQGFSPLTFKKKKRTTEKMQ